MFKVRPFASKRFDFKMKQSLEDELRMVAGREFSDVIF